MEDQKPHRRSESYDPLEIDDVESMAFTTECRQSRVERALDDLREEVRRQAAEIVRLGSKEDRLSQLLELMALGRRERDEATLAYKKSRQPRPPRETDA